MRTIATIAMMFTVACALTACNKVTELKMDYEAQQFREECFGNNTYDCVNRRVEFNLKLLEMGKKQWEDTHEKAVAVIGEERYELVLAVFNRNIDQQKADRPNWFMRTFFGDDQVPYPVPDQYLYSDDDLNRIIHEAVQLVKATHGLPPMPRHGGASAPAPNPPQPQQQPQTIGDALTQTGVATTSASPPSAVPVSAPAPTPAPSVPASYNAMLSKLFVHDAVQGSVPWVESIAGPAHQVLNNGDGTQTRVYEVDGCHVTANASNNTINSLTLEISQTCNVPMQAMVPNASPLNIANLTFADLFKEGASGITMTCAGPGECGNSADPSIQASLGGDHADDFREVDFSGTITNDSDLNAMLSIMADEGKRLHKTDDQLTDKVYNADPQLAELAKARLGGVKVTSITFKSGL